MWKYVNPGIGEDDIKDAMWCVNMREEIIRMPELLQDKSYPYTLIRCPKTKDFDYLKVDKLDEQEFEETTLVTNLKKWNTYTLLNALNILKSDIPDEVKAHLYRFPEQIVNISQIEAFFAQLKLMISNVNPLIIHQKNQKTSDADYPISIIQKVILDGNLIMIEFTYQEQQEFYQPSTQN
jgi:hypothetical protein